MAMIFLLEDDKNLNKGIKISLEKDNHTVISAHSFFEGVENYMKQKFDLFLLDINLPDGNGLMFCKKIRETNQNPIIFLTANDTEEEMLEGFKAGCDDYISKPFSIPVLRQKVLALLRRFERQELETAQFQYMGLEANFDRMLVKKNNSEIKLTATEYKLLECLISNKGKVLTRSMLLEQVWDIESSFVDENTLSVHIRRLRQKLEDDPKNPKYIITVFGIGYTFGA